MSDIGPQIPPHILAKRKRQQEEVETAKRSTENREGTSNTNEDDVSEKRPRTVGPTLPPAPIDQMPSMPANSDDSNDDSSDDDIGPSLPATFNDEDEEAAARIRLAKHQSDDGSKSEDKPATRDEWMLVPPKHEDWTQRVDPTKIKNRKFQTGKGAKAPTVKSGDSALWTETPEQKLKRLNDEVMGIRKPVSQIQPDEDDRARRLRNDNSENIRQRINEYNDANRSKTLYDEHQATRDKDEDDDPSKRAFDREKDIVGASKQIGLQQKKDMMNRAKDFGSRFSSGKFL